MRERHILKVVLTSSKGITPARAGKTTLVSFEDDRLGDHPRSCGKDYGQSAIHRIVAGSPPLVRERLTEAYKTAVKEGITPARAGKT